MALMEQGLDQQARDMIDATQATESWEHAIGLLLHAHCLLEGTLLPRLICERTLCDVTVLLAQPDPSTATFQTSAGLAALDVAPPTSTSARCSTPSAMWPNSTPTPRTMSFTTRRRGRPHPDQAVALDGAVAEAGLGAGNLPTHHHKSLKSAVTHAESELARLLRSAV